LGLQGGDDGISVIVIVGISWRWRWHVSWERGAVGNIVIKGLDSKKENRLVSTEKEINNTINIPLGPNNTSHHLGPVCPLTPRVSDIGNEDELWMSLVGAE
jgi:hypothetical protein